MSRIGKKPIDIPQGVEITVNGSEVTVKGPKGTLTQSFSTRMSFEQENGQLLVKRPDDSITSKMLHGTTRALINNMVKGVVSGFEKTLVISGVGYEASMTNGELKLKVGYANPIMVKPIEGVEVSVPDPLTIVVKGIDKAQVGNYAANIRGWRPPEPYKGKGVLYDGEVVRKKEGKSGAA